MSDTQDIINQARGYNVGDLSLGLKPNQTRENVLNAEHLIGNVFPNDLINKAQPRANFSFRWCSMDDSPYSNKFIADSKREGYLPVVESEWVVNQDAWAWHTPDKKRYRWSVTNMLINGYDEFLMYRDEIRWKEEQDRRLYTKDEQIKARMEQSVTDAARASRNSGVGVEVEATLGGETIKDGGPRRTIVS